MHLFIKKTNLFLLVFKGSDRFRVTNFRLLVFGVLTLSFILCFNHPIMGHVQTCSSDQVCTLSDIKDKSAQPSQSVIKHVLENGFTVLIQPIDTMQNVAIELVIQVGSKHEEMHQKGVAHLIEHMLFKGTHQLSESDISLIQDKLSGHFNAFTSFDWTKMICQVPLSSWQQVIPIFADCMTNCTFKEEFLNSELKTVVQKLKMYRDNYSRTLIHELLSVIYPDHPYHYPVVGYKQDLWNSSVESLKEFYKKHYVPNNALLVVVGNVNPYEVIDHAKAAFGSLKKDPTYKQPEWYLNKDLRTQSVTLYRDVEKSLVKLAFMVPGLKERDIRAAHILNEIVFTGKTSRLYKKLKEDQLVDSIGSLYMDLFESDLYVISFIPRKSKYLDQIIQIILDEIRAIITDGCTHDELKKALKQIAADHYSSLEGNAYQADFISRYYMALRDENYLDTVQEDLGKQDAPSLDKLNHRIKKFASTYIRPQLMHKGYVLPIPDGEEGYWRALQQRSDDEDSRILSGKVRTSPVEPGKYVHTVSDENVFTGTLPQPHVGTLKNGIRVYAYHTSHVPLLMLNLYFKDSRYHEPEDQSEVVDCLCALFNKIGTQKRNAAELHHLFEHSAIRYRIDRNGLHAKMMSDDFHTFAPLLLEALTQPVFDEESLSKIKAEKLAAYESSFDEEQDIAADLARKTVFRSLNDTDREESYPTKINRISIDDINNAYRKTVSHDGARMVIVGNIGDYTKLFAVLDQTFGTWKGHSMPESVCKAEVPAQPTRKTYHIDRDQTILTFAGASVSHSDPDYFPLLIYNAHVGSRLFALRHSTGAFYAIRGSVLSNAGNSQGIASITTIVSPDRCEEVQGIIRDFIEHDSERFGEDDLELAKQTILKKRIQHFVDNNSLMELFVSLDKNDLPFDYLDTLPDQLKSITVDDVKRAVSRVFNANAMSTILVGRIGKPDTCSETPIITSP